MELWTEELQEHHLESTDVGLTNTENNVREIIDAEGHPRGENNRLRSHARNGNQLQNEHTIEDLLPCNQHSSGENKMQW